MIRRTLVVLSAISSVAFSALPSWSAPATLILLHTNDTHDHLTPYDKRDIHSIGGIARRTTIIKKEQTQNAGKVLVLDAGDTFQGTPIFNFFHGQADYEAMDAAGYDATTVGNHDLDDGLANLQKQMKGRRFKLISTNLLDAASGQPLFTGSAIFDRSGLKVGVFGITGEGGAWDAVAAKNKQGIKILDAVPTARKAIDDLKARGANFIVMLSHCGNHEDKQLAAAVKGIHVIVGGHSHTKVDTPDAVRNGDWTTLVLQAYQWGEFVGRLELGVEGGKVVSSNGYLVPVAGDTPEDPDVARIVAGYDSQIREKMAKVIGQAPRGLSYESKGERDCDLGNWATDLLRTTSGADVAFLNSGGLRAPLNPGPVKVGDIFAVFPFDNRVVKLQMTGALLQKLLDQVAARQVSMLQVSGLTFRIAGRTATDIKVGGTVLDPAKTYQVTTIDYIAQGNDRYTTFTEGTGYKDLGTTVRDYVMDYVKANPTVVPPSGQRITLGN